MSTQTLSSALDALVATAERAGLDPAAARAEGETLAAAVAEPSVGAYVAWAEQTGRPADAEQFFTAASKGRRWRVSPTAQLSELVATGGADASAYASALAAVCTAATTLGRPSPLAMSSAMDAAAVQLSAANGSAPMPTGPSGPTPNSPAMPSSTSLDLPGLDADLATRLADSEDRRKAMDAFTEAGPSILGGVLDQLKANADRISALRNGDAVNLSGMSGWAGSAGGNVPGSQSAPGAPGGGATGAPAEPAQTATQDPPAEATPEKPAEPEKSLDELLAELDDLVGLETVKSEIHRQTAVLKVGAMREKAGLKNATLTRHLVFVGNPGTGKTTVARLVGGIYKALGLLSKGQLVEVDRSELVAGYLGQTALKTAEVCKSALGGVLFIDEAYSLSGDQYGEEAINTLVKEMEDNRSDLVVIVAGYPVPMAKFIAENPGLASRFRTTITFDNYTDDELIDIFAGMIAKADYDLGEGALDSFTTLLAAQLRDDTFGNGRFARNVMEAAIGHQAWRLRNAEEPTVDDLRTLTAADVLGDAATEVVEWQAADQDVPESEEATPEEASDEALPDADQPPTEGEATP